MMEDTYTGTERRQFARLEYVTPLAYKVCKQETVSKLLEGYTSDISVAGLRCNIKHKVNQDDILWLAFDKDVLIICEDLDKRCLIYQNGILGKVVRIETKAEDNSFDVGIQFVTREEKNITNIYPKVRFSEDKLYDEQT
jgi:hypothetical protein